MVEHPHVCVRLGEVVPPQPRGSDHRHVHTAHAVFGGAAVGVDHAVALAAAGAVPVLAAGLAAGRAAQRFGAGADVVDDGVPEALLENGIVGHLRRAKRSFVFGVTRRPDVMVPHQQVQGADLVGHQTRDLLQRGQPLLKALSSGWFEENVSNAFISTQNLSGSLRESLRERCSVFQIFALAVAELCSGTDGHLLDVCFCLHGQTVADRVEGHLTHGGLASPYGRHGVHPTPQVDSTDEVSSVDGDELLEGRGVLVVVCGGEVHQGHLKLFTERRPRVKTEAGITKAD